MRGRVLSEQLRAKPDKNPSTNETTISFKLQRTELTISAHDWIYPESTSTITTDFDRY
jgi:hypothetical protein